jgi:hypothetical protein
MSRKKAAPSTNLIFCDIDGIIADFSLEFTRMAAIYYKTPVISTPDVQDWWYSDLGLSEEQCRKIMERISNTLNFWRKVPPLPEGLSGIMRILQVSPVVFFTSRFPTIGDSVWTQTVSWFQIHGIQEPVLLVAQNSIFPHPLQRPTKSELVEVWRPWLVIEDNPYELEALSAINKNNSFILWAYDRAYNRDAPANERGSMTNLLEFLGLGDDRREDVS